MALQPLLCQRQILRVEVIHLPEQVLIPSVELCRHLGENNRQYRLAESDTSFTTATIILREELGSTELEKNPTRYMYQMKTVLTCFSGPLSYVPHDSPVKAVAQVLAPSFPRTENESLTQIEPSQDDSGSLSTYPRAPA